MSGYLRKDGGGREEKGKKITKRHKAIFRGKVVLVNLTTVVVSLQYTYIKNQDFHFKYVQFTVCQSYLNEAVNT